MRKTTFHQAMLSNLSVRILLPRTYWKMVTTAALRKNCWGYRDGNTTMVSTRG